MYVNHYKHVCEETFQSVAPKRVKATYMYISPISVNIVHPCPFLLISSHGVFYFNFKEYMMKANKI